LRNPEKNPGSNPLSKFGEAMRGGSRWIAKTLLEKSCIMNNKKKSSILILRTRARKKS
jgi:hypothetical protein